VTLAGALGSALLLALPLDGAARGRPLVSLSAVPARVELVGRASESVTVTNFGSTRVLVSARAGNLAVDLRGRPSLVARRTAPRSAAPWLSLSPRELSLPAGGTALLRVESLVPMRAEPGDHHAVVLLSTRPAALGAVGVRMRLGVRVAVRVPGVVVRRLGLVALRVRRHGRVRTLEATLANGGNVTETLSSARVAISLHVPGRPVVRLGIDRRELLPGRRGIAVVRYRGPLRGRVRAVVSIDGAAGRTFWIRL
jgi:hypothetical protein